ncbi:hypothetical protein [Chryseobacterium ginsenosidimutans]|uniref:hypothetical protein n=1 Tax=Chryseobacterium ginsenosidimutans TaxID=687846 RepID=UPI0027B941AC|nr:hypothetical protein [Chryseobacterium ginsenosidimutans]
MTKKLISWLSLLIVFFTLLWSCRQEDLSMKEENNRQLVLSSKILHYQDLEKRKAVFGELIKLTKDNGSSKTTRTYTDQENGFSVDLEDCMYLEDPKGQKSYTFTIVRDKPEESNPDILENFVLVDKGNNIFESYLFRYEKDVQLNYFKSNEELKRNLTQKVKIFGLGEQKNILATSKIALCVGVMATYVEQPGTSCISGLHTYGDGAACDYWGTVDMALPSYGGHFVYTFDANDCYGGGGAGSAGSGSGTTGPYHGGGSGTGTIQDNPCTKIKAKFSNVKFKEKVQAIDKPDVFDYDHEMGFAVAYPVNTTITETQYQSMENSLGTHNVVLPNGNQYFGYIHSHNNESNGGSPVKIFSYADLITFLTSCVRNADEHGSIGDAYCMVITSEGNYILQYTGIGDYSVGPNQVKNWEKWYKREYQKLADEDELTQINVEKTFARFLAESIKINGLDIYHVEKETGKASKLNINGTKTSCP